MEIGPTTADRAKALSSTERESLAVVISVPTTWKANLLTGRPYQKVKLKKFSE